jgi:hypothetical protein
VKYRMTRHFFRRPEQQICFNFHFFSHRQWVAEKMTIKRYEKH